MGDSYSDINQCVGWKLKAVFCSYLKILNSLHWHYVVQKSLAEKLIECRTSADAIFQKIILSDTRYIIEYLGKIIIEYCCKRTTATKIYSPNNLEDPNITITGCLSWPGGVSWMKFLDLGTASKAVYLPIWRYFVITAFFHFCMCN